MKLGFGLQVSRVRILSVMHADIQNAALERVCQAVQWQMPDLIRIDLRPVGDMPAMTAAIVLQGCSLLLLDRRDTG